MAVLKKDLNVVKREIKALEKKLEKLFKALEQKQKAVKAKITKKAPAKKKPATKKAPAKKVKAAGKASQPTATDQILRIVKRSKKGVDVPTLKKKTGFDDKKIRNIIFRAAKDGKIQKTGRGVYRGA
jgi:hypothetical protein